MLKPLSVLCALASAPQPIAAAGQAPERSAPAHFDVSAPAVSADMDARADAKRSEAIEKLRHILSTVGDGEQKAELIFRLAELYWAKAKSEHLKAMRAWDAALDAWVKGGRKGPQPTLESVAAHDQSEAFRRQALELYNTILANYPGYPRRDEVLYDLASSLYESSRKQDGVAMYRKLLKEHPDSAFAPDAWLQLGEHFFSANELHEAVTAYDKAVAAHKPRIYSYALYKLAWCDFNLQDYQAAIGKFRQVIAYAKAQQGAAPSQSAMAERDRIQLTEEALNDMVRAYARLDGVSAAFEFYVGELGAQPAYKYLRHLAGLYRDAGKHELAIKTYQELNRRYPYAAEAPSNHAAIMTSCAQLGRVDQVRSEVRRLIDLYSPESEWAKKNAGNPSVLSQAFDKVEQELASLVTEKHREAQGTRLVETYQLARDIYREYLEKFTKSVNSYRFRFFYAEILFELKQFPEAAAQYTAVVKQNPKDELAKPAAYAAILAWDRVRDGAAAALGARVEPIKQGRGKGALASVEKLGELQKGQSYQPTTLTETEEKLAAACDTFVEVAPTDEEAPKVSFKSARIYYAHNRFDEATRRFGEIVARWPKDKLARVAGEAILQTLNGREDWTGLNQWSRRLRANKALIADKTFAASVTKLVEGASFNEIHQVYEPKEQPFAVAERYVTFVHDFPTSEFVPVALYNAIVSYERASRLDKAIARAESYLKLAAPQDLREKVMFLLASSYERVTELDKAAGYYEAYAREFRNAARRPDALFNAGLLREGLGQLDRGIANLRAYVSDYPDKDDILATRWRLGLILEKRQDFKAAESHFVELRRQAAARDPARAYCAGYKVLQNRLAQGKEKQASAELGQLIAEYERLAAGVKSDPCALDAVAHASFLRLEPDFQAYLALQLSGNEKEMARKLVRKLEMVDDLQRRYTNVLKLGQGDYGIAALYRVGQTYQHLAQAIYNTPCPKRLDEDQCAIYQSALQERAFPLEEKAIEAYDKAVAKAYELELYNGWLVKAADALKPYEPSRFPERRDYPLVASEAVFDLSARAKAEAADTARKTLLGDPSSVAAMKTLGLVYVGQGKLDLAEMLFRSALRLAAKDATIRVDLAIVAFRRGEHPKAMRELERALALDPSSAVVEANIGAIALAFHDYARAKRAYEHAIALGMVNCTTMSALGYASEGLQQGKAAVAQLAKAYELCPKDVELLFSVGTICMGQLRDNACALKSFERYVTSNKGLTESHRVFGLIKTIKGVQAEQAALPVAPKG